MYKITLNQLRNFWNKVNICDENNCWNWQAGIDKNGYGRFSIFKDNKHTSVRVNRISYFIHYGTFDFSLSVLHSCDNPACVNPKHLFLGTHQDNMKDKAKKGRQPDYRGENNNLSVLTKFQVLEIRQKYATGDYTQQELANIYKVKRQTISDITRRKNWKHI